MSYRLWAHETTPTTRPPRTQAIDEMLAQLDRREQARRTPLISVVPLFLAACAWLLWSKLKPSRQERIIEADECGIFEEAA